jgi:hypothetical protein
MVLADARWDRLLTVRFAGGFTVTDIGSHEDRQSFAAAMRCDD